MRKPPSGRISSGIRHFLFACGLLWLASCSAPPRPAMVPADWPSWRKTTNIELNYPIPGHEDKYRVIRINDLGWNYAAGSTEGRMDFPRGTIIAKEIYSTSSPKAGDAPSKLTVMVKAPDDPDARGGWIWIVKDLATGGETVMTGAFCYICHNNANESHPYGDRNPREEFRDFVFFPPGRDGTSSLPRP